MAEIIIFNDINGLIGFGRYSGPYRIASELRSHGYDVQVVEFFASLTKEELDQILDRYLDDTTIIVGIASTLLSKYYSDAEYVSLLEQNTSLMQIMNSSWTDLFPQDATFVEHFFNTIRKRSNRCKIVVGGYKATKSNHKIPNIDYWILGQGEGSIIALANHLKYGADIKFLHTNHAVLLTDTMYPFAEFSTSKITWTDRDFLFSNESIPIETARGCIFKCSFCSFNLNGKKFGDYNKCSETLREEFIYNYETFGITDYMIADDTLNDSQEKIDHLHTTITSLPFKITFSAYCRLDIIDTHFDMAIKLKEMGLTSVNFGIETFNRLSGKHIGKGADPDSLKQTLQKLRKLWGDDVYMSAGFIVGLPYETKESIYDTFEYLYSDANPLSAVGVYPYFLEGSPNIKFPKEQKATALESGFSENKQGLTWKHMSKISANPDEYGYAKLGNSSWQSQIMTSDEARALVKEFHDNPACPQKFSLTYFQDYNRMKNLGFKHHEIKNMYNTDINHVNESQKRKKLLRTTYMAKLLS